MKDATNAIIAGQIVKFEGQTLGVLSELLPKPVRLKRELVKLFEQPPAEIGDAAHLIVKTAIEAFVSPAAKKTKLG